MSDSTGGSFGSNSNRGTRMSPKPKKAEKEKIHKEKSSIANFLERISPENWVDIVCCTLIAVFVIVVACNWQECSEWLFRYILFPVISIGAKLVALVGGVAAIIGAVTLWIRSRSRRRWWW